MSNRFKANIETYLYVYVCKRILLIFTMFSESLGHIDNGQLKNAVTEVEDMLTSLIDTVENSRASSVQTVTHCLKESGQSSSRHKYV